MPLARDWLRNGHVTKFRSMKYEGRYTGSNLEKISSFLRQSHEWRKKSLFFRTLHCLDGMPCNYSCLLAPFLKATATLRGQDRKTVRTRGHKTLLGSSVSEILVMEGKWDFCLFVCFLTI